MLTNFLTAHSGQSFKDYKPSLPLPTGVCSIVADQDIKLPWSKILPLGFVIVTTLSHTGQPITDFYARARMMTDAVRVQISTAIQGLPPYPLIAGQQVFDAALGYPAITFRIGGKAEVSASTGVSASQHLQSISSDGLDHIARLSTVLSHALQQEPVLDGFHHPAESILQEMFRDHPAESSKWVLGHLSERGAYSRAADVLKLLCRFKPESADWRRSIVEIALQSSSDEVRDIAIQAIESWDEPDLIPILRAHPERVPWLADYASQVLRDLEG
jgi:hypothetical protein